jgi:hypothetical protein
MLDCLKIDDVQGKKECKWWIGGADLLQLAQYAVDSINTAGAVAQGDGTYDYPWVLDGEVRTWMQLSKTLKSYTREACYFWICGRFVKKAGGYYMVDAGGDDGKNGYQPWDQKVVTTNRSVTKVPFDRGGPSYRNFANRLKEIHDSKPKSMEVWSQDKAKKLVKVLLDDPDYSRKLRAKGDYTTGQVLPVLAATLFLAEPARNIRCFLINKMLLDMLVTGTTYGGRKEGSSPKQYRLDTVLLRDPQNKGGKLPAAMTGSATAAKPIAPSSLPSAMGTGAYTQAKELTILCHYFNAGSYEGTNESDVDKKAYKQIVVTRNPLVSDQRDISTAAGVLGWLKFLMQQTLHSFNP